MDMMKDYNNMPNCSGSMGYYPGMDTDMGMMPQMGQMGQPSPNAMAPGMMPQMMPYMENPLMQNPMMYMEYMYMYYKYMCKYLEYVEHMEKCKSPNKESE